MTDEMIDDVKALIDGDFGDDQILKDVYRACKNGEVISNYERKYVRDLAGRYLKRPGDTVAAPEEAVAPDVALPGAAGEVRPSDGRAATAAAGGPSDDCSVRLISSTARMAGGRSKTKKVAFIGIALLLVVAIVAVAATTTAIQSPGGLPDTSNEPDTNPDAQQIIDEFYVATDLDGYSSGDFILIHGWSDVDGTVDLSIQTAAGKVVWSDSVPVKPDGAYSTIVIAGGGASWTTSGTFAVDAKNGDGVVATAEFEFAR